MVAHDTDSAAEAGRFIAISDERNQWERYALAMWEDGYRAGAGDVMQAFGDGWRHGLEAGAERGTAA
jgi:hypothetical protein